ncbi:hypothetical protein Plhal304r1_c060g0146531 [Plasmopara halstedii]
MNDDLTQVKNLGYQSNLVILGTTQSRSSPYLQQKYTLESYIPPFKSYSKHLPTILPMNLADFFYVLYRGCLPAPENFCFLTNLGSKLSQLR